MPKIARDALIQRLYHSGLLDRLQTDVRILFRKRLRFLAPEETVKGAYVEVPLYVGAVHIGKFAFKASARAERNQAYLRWLQMAARIFAEELSHPQAHTSNAVPAKIAKAAAFIRKNHRENLSLADVASEVRLSRERLSRLFHETLGITFSEYLTQSRLTSARQLLRETDASITEIAYESGFQSLSQFNRHFAKFENMAPREYRKSARTPSAASRID